MSSVPPLTSDQANAAGKTRTAVFAGAAGEDTAPEDTAAVNAMRKAGKTTTVGDVSRRAAYVFHQTGQHLLDRRSDPGTWRISARCRRIPRS